MKPLVSLMLAGPSPSCPTAPSPPHPPPRTPARPFQATKVTTPAPHRSNKAAVVPIGTLHACHPAT